MLAGKFEEQVIRTPDYIAVKAREFWLTYRQLNAYANRIAHWLKTLHQDSCDNTILGLLFDHGIDMIASLLAVLKTGNVYVPLPLDYPVNRLAYMVNHSGCRLILTNSVCSPTALQLAGKSGVPLLNIDDIPRTTPRYHQQKIDGNHLAYIMYTSGSTGNPRGVMQTHENVCYHIKPWTQQFHITPGDRLTLFSSFGHDASVMDIYGALLNGAALYPLNMKNQDETVELSEFLVKEKITVWHSVPSLFNYFAGTLNGQEELKHLRYIILGGEAIRQHEIDMFKRHFPYSVLAGIYGQTESSVNAIRMVRPQDTVNKSILGDPREKTRIFVVDPDGNEVSALRSGEILIACPHVSPGYWQDRAGTTSSFAADDEFGRLYWTGDMGRLLLDNNIEFNGRKDHQVKIRGFRVEPGEIESQLLRCPGISEAVVVQREDQQGNQYLAAYFVMSPQGKNPAPPPTALQLREFLAQHLPDYMIPAFFVPLERLPLTQSNKIDRRALPEPEIQSAQKYTAPRDKIEKTMTQIWAEVLGIPAETIGLEAHFFELGGHSLKAAALVSLLHQALEIDIPLSRVFQAPTVKQLSHYVKKAKREKYLDIPLAEVREYYPLSSAQKRLYFLQQMDPGSIAYNMPLALPLGKEADKNKIIGALKRLIARHESLRTAFVNVNDLAVQRVYKADQVEFKFEYYDLAAEDREQKTENGKQETDGKSDAYLSSTIRHLSSEFVRPFDLSQAPLIRSGLIRLPDNHYTWLLDLHHIISDGTSRTILAEDFNALYNDTALTPLVIQYKDFSQWQNRLFQSGKIKEQELYWLKLFQGETPRLDLPVDFKRPEVFTFAGARYSFGLEPEQATRFKALGTAVGGTLYMNLLAALNTLFYKYTGQTDIIIGSGTAGRNHTELQGVVGMFINTLAMRNYPHGEKTYETFLNEVINNSIKALENQDVQFEDLVDRLEPERNPSRNPLFDISMVVQNYQQIGKTKSNNENNSLAEILPRVNETQSPVKLKNLTSKFDMTFFVHESKENIRIIIEYYTGIFKEDTIKRLIWHFQRITRAVIKDPTIKLKEIDIVSPEEKNRVLYEFNNTGADYAGDKTLHALFSDQVEQTPDHMAVVQGEALHISYRQLNERANQITRYLCREKGVKPGEPVGIWMSQLLMRPAVILGILKAGAAYVPLDPSLPEQRLKYMIRDANINIVISEKKYVKQLNRLQWECKFFNCYLSIDSSDIHNEDEVERSELMDVELWRHVGETAVDDITAGGWISSYTGKPFSPKEMDEYGDNILAKLQPLLHPKMKVLEIGCASGISMYRIAPKVAFYYGTDLSPVIIDKNKQRIEKQGHQNIKLKTMAAHEIHQLKIQNNKFHLIIINSVIQCFPGHNYLGKVIKQAIDLLEEKGHLFIGDIMDQEKKQTLVRELNHFKRNNKDKEYTTKTDFSSELFISRGFWEDLGIEFNQIETIEFSNKIYTVENELTKFRYDVLMTINKQSPKVKPYEKQKHQDDGRFLTSPGPTGSSGLTTNGCSHYPAYIIYTSGTTGMPKGVMIEHRSVVNLCYWHRKNYEITKADHATLYAGFGFDASVWELFPYLLTGAVLYIVDESLRPDIENLNRYFQRCRITIGFLPTQLCEQFMTLDNTNRSLRVLLTGGDKLRTFTPRGYQLYNNYGPTENTVVTTSYPVKHLLDNIPIGKPIDNNYIYILDKESFHLQSVGIPGELCISGIGLARGYLNNPELTAERFFSKSHQSDKSYRTYIPKKIYKSGDLARWLPDGNIEFLGRIDQQVKIRGFRIELEEIESQIKKQDGIKDASVITRENESADKYLCAYVVPLSTAPSDSIDLTLVREYLAATLPDYMIPLHFVQMETLPLTPSGKVDRKALPKPRAEAGEHYAAPGNQIEKTLTGIWAEILGLETNIISIDHNFFELGGHSLKATILAAKIHKELGIKIPLVKIFKTSTIRELGEYISAARKEQYTVIEPVEKKEYYTLSSAQKRLYILQQMKAEHIGYNMPQIIPLEENIDIKKLELAFKKLIARHESLRTSFHMIKDEPVQKINHQVEFRIETGDNEGTRGLAPLPLEPAAALASSFLHPFDLSQAPLLRVMTLDNQSPGSKLFIDMHHIITDGTSQNILKNELLSLYAHEKLTSLRLQYKDYAQWQNNRNHRASITAQEDYWLKIFPDELPVLNLPTDFPRPLTKSFEGSTIAFILTTAQTKKIKDLVKKANITLFMLVMTVFTVLLSKLGNQEDIIVGIPIMGRRHADLERIIGMFVNTLALRNYPIGNKTFKEYLLEVKQSTLAAFENQDYQFDDLVKQFPAQRDADRNPVFDVMLNFLNQRDYTDYTLETDKQRLYRHQKGVSKFDLTLTAIDLGENLSCSFEYSTDLFESHTIDRMIKYFKMVVDLILADPGQKLSEIGIITGLEKNRILYEFNDTGTDYPRDKTIHECFEHQAAQIPNRIIVIDTPPGVHLSGRHRQISYRELNQRANQLADFLREKGVKPDTIISIMMERSIEMIIGILGILKAGGAYLPIDPDYPEERIQYMLKDSSAKILLKENDFTPEALNNRPKGASSFGIWDLEFGISPRQGGQLAYILYTSGSTGKPKGVMVNHHSVLRLVKNTNFITFDSRDRLLQTGAVDFDASTFEIWGPLLNGALLCLASRDDLLNPHRLKSLIRQKDITIMWMTAPLFNRMLQEDIEIFWGLKSLLVGGDVLSPPHIRQIKEKYPQLNVIDGYGPTENTTFSTTHPVHLPIAGTIPIGKPIANSTAYILDNYGHLAPPGLTGELVVGGDGVARGYLNNPELTRERFFSFFNRSYKSYRTYISSRVYRTGDLARWLSDGTIEFLGRQDFQVKIRGFRIEPGEIENRLLNHPHVTEAVVIDRRQQGKETNEKYLCAYIVPGRNQKLKPLDLRKYLAAQLPDYMVPAHFVLLERIPLNSNGKVQRNALPEPGFTTGKNYVPPGCNMEKKLAAIWCEVLNWQGTIGINDNFFDMGGHSLTVTTMASKIYKEFNVRIPLVEIFNTPFIRDLAEYIKKETEERYASIEPVEKKEFYALSSAQKRLYVLQQMETAHVGYNLPQIIPLEENIDIQKLESTFKELIARHDSLRTSFHMVKDEPVQKINHQAEFRIEIDDNEGTRGLAPLTLEPASPLISSFIRPFDLSQAPLLRLMIIESQSPGVKLFVDMHHIITDGASQNILQNELLSLYSGAKLPALRLQYKDYAQFQNSRTHQVAITAQEDY